MRAAFSFVVMATTVTVVWAQTPQTVVVVRGHQQTLHLYGPPERQPIIVSSGDGGWIHLGPHVAQMLAEKGFRVVGFDVSAFLTSFTSGTMTLRVEDEPTDYRVFARDWSTPSNGFD